MPFTFTFTPSQNQTFELRCDYGTRRLDTHELGNLIKQCEENYYSQKKDDIGLLREIGRKLYSWLDGKEGWLRRALSESTDKKIYLDLIKTSEATAMFFCRTRGGEHPQLKELEDRSFKLLLGAASGQGIETQEAFDAWFVEKQLSDPQYFIPRLAQQLEAIIGDGWVFNPGEV